MALPGRLRRASGGGAFSLPWWRPLIAVEGGARVLAPHLDPVDRWPRHDYTDHEAGLARRSDDLGLLVLGSSIAGRAVAPDDLAAAGGPGPGYNFWLAGPPMRSVSMLAVDVLLPRTNPEVVIIGLSMREFNDGPAVRDHLAALEQSPAFRAASGRANWVDRLDDGLQGLSATARYRQTLRDPAELVAQIRRSAPVPETLGPDGFLAERGDDRVDDEPAAHIAQETSVMADYEVNQSDLDALGDLLAALDRRGVAALVVNLPVTDRFIALADDGRDDYDAYLSQVRSVTYEHGAYWLDALGTGTWSDEAFGDMNHLNDRGTQRLEPLLLDALADIPSLSPPTQRAGTVAGG